MTIEAAIVASVAALIVALLDEARARSRARAARAERDALRSELLDEHERTRSEVRQLPVERRRPPEV